MVGFQNNPTAILYDDEICYNKPVQEGTEICHLSGEHLIPAIKQI